MASLPLLSPPSTELDGERNTTHYHSAWGTEPPVEYLPSESTTELVDFKSSRNSGDIIGTDRPTAWHPKLTLYRLVVIFSTVGLGVAKDVTSYLNLTYASITLEWILGVVLFLVLHILGIYELAYTYRMTWFFGVDYLDYLWKFLHRFTGIHRPNYTSDEDDSAGNFSSDHPPVTGYRLLVMSTIFVVGMTKSVLVYGNRQTDATSLECVVGVFGAIGLYWLGLYEASSTKVYPFLFHVDYSPGIAYLLSTGSNVAWFSLHLIGMLLAAGLTCAFSFLVYVIYRTDYSTPTLPPFIGLINKAFFMSVPIAVCATGPGCIFMLVENIYKHSEPYLAQFPSFVIFQEIYKKYWLPAPHIVEENNLFYLKRVLIRQVIKLPRNLFLLLVVFICLMACIFLFINWIIVVIPYVHSLWVFVWLLASVIILPAIGIFLYMALNAFYVGVCEFVADVKKDGSVDQLDAADVQV